MPNAHRKPFLDQHSKGEVNRAGALLSDLRRRIATEGPERAVAQFDEAELDEAWEVLTWWRSLHARPLSSVAANLRYHVEKADARVAGRIEVTQRLKRLPTLIGKLDRHKGNVTQMQDVGGVRAVVPGLPQVYGVRRRLLKSWSIVRERDYIETPKEDGYRAVHLIVSRGGFKIEVQLRTVSQDIWANVVEEQSRILGMDLKFGGGSPELKEHLTRLAELLSGYDRGVVSRKDLIDDLVRLPILVLTTGSEGT